MHIFRSRRKEKRSFTSLSMLARASGVTGYGMAADLSATVATCAVLWECGLSLAVVRGARVPAAMMAMAGRSLALTGNALFLIDGGNFLPAAEYTVGAEKGRPVSYRLTIPGDSGGEPYTALAEEVLHFRIGASMREPWGGVSPLRRAPLSASLLAEVEGAMRDVYRDAPIGSQVVTTPEEIGEENQSLSASFRGRRGGVLLRESVQVAAGGGPTPQTDWKPADLTPDLKRSMILEANAAARAGILGVYGVLPALLGSDASGQSIREAQRHLAQWQLQPIGELMADELSEKLSADVGVSVLQGTQAFDSGGRARALKGRIDAIAEAKAAGLSDETLAAAMQGVGLGD